MLNPTSSQTSSSPFHERKVLVGLTGGIACYKVATLVSRLVQRGASVRVIMTEAATHFVTPLTFQSLSGHPVLTGIWQSDDHPRQSAHRPGTLGHLYIIAPCTANTLAKLAHGLSDDLVSLAASALPREPKMTPVLLAPAMNAQMWENPITQRNLTTVREILKYQTVGPESGWQACRTSGAGRMSEPEAILDAAEKLLISQ
ncbi:MAG: hypothetical protein HC898_00065 [Phycisphaerales bacterium]|nr:hypothetical protein [Phycisphaerales bacterium]